MAPKQSHRVRKAPRSPAPGQGYQETSRRQSDVRFAVHEDREANWLARSKSKLPKKVQSHEVSRTRSGHVFRVLDGLTLPHDLYPATMILQMSRVFLDDEYHAEARMLCFDVLHHAQELGLLKGYSPTITATACVHFASFLIDRDLLTKNAVRDLLPIISGVRNAYNELWLARRGFEDLAKRYGGGLEDLEPPYSYDGKSVNTRLIKQDEEGERRPARRTRTTRVMGRVGSRAVSKLRFVENSEDEESAEDALGRMSIDG